MASAAQIRLAKKTAFKPITNYGISKVTCEAMGQLLF